MKTSEELHALHRELWGWLAKTGSARKEYWPGWIRKSVKSLFRDGNPEHCAYCFACLSVDMKCSICPIEWGGKPHYDNRGTTCEWDGSPFLEWSDALGEKERKEQARIIRDLPWSERPEVGA